MKTLRGTKNFKENVQRIWLNPLVLVLWGTECLTDTKNKEAVKTKSSLEQILQNSSASTP